MKGRMLYVLYVLVCATIVAGGLWAASAQDSRPKKEPDLEEFEPSERVPADTSVPFPVDI
jgi:hypothetical protein